MIQWSKKKNHTTDLAFEKEKKKEVLLVGLKK